MSSSGAAVQKSEPANSTDEPSMEEILASIRDIIAEDEPSANKHETRENFTHPDNPSNTNLTHDDSDDANLIEQELQGEIEAEMTRDLEAQASIEGQISKPETAVIAEPVIAEVAVPSAATPAKNVDITYDRAAVPSQKEQSASGSSLQERAQKVREKLGLAEAGSMTLEERLEKYRVRGRQQASEESVIPELPATAPVVNAKSNSADEAVIAAPVGAETVAPVVEQASAAIAMPSAEDVARALLDGHTGTMGSELDEQIRPMVRQWLNDNLPTLVERLVREEIQRVSQIRKASA